MRHFAWGLGAALLLAGCGAFGNVHIAPVTAMSQVAAKAVGFASARDGLFAAQSAARPWDGAASLARIEGTDIEAGYMAGDWAYTFYAPAKREEALVVVWDGSRTKTYKIRKDPAARPILSGSFNIDSKQAVAIAEKNGLKSRRVHDLSLGEANPQFRLQWTLNAPEGEYVVDALTGQLLQKP
ncbi:MAG: hypothetical protein FJZ01_06300 [Candidatus Sericytochromatia bacterium]|nr:hypothetical protein [Candidatus Tanganyikabacteria bacterium]